jgi:glycosyltransferase involved in cell wall biosynthesis
MPRVLIVRGHLVTPWELRPWLELPEEFEVRCLLTRSNIYPPPDALRYFHVRAVRDVMPRGRSGEILTRAVGDRYLSAGAAFRWADIVHAEELSFWFAADAARRRGRANAQFRLVQTVWETLPLLNAFRNRGARVNRRAVLDHTDLFLPTTERAGLALSLEGVEDERIRICPPGIDVGRFAVGAPAVAPAEHVVVSAGRLVWEKGHQDVLRALALLRRQGSPRTRLQIIGSGPEQARLLAYAAELGLADDVEIGSVPYDEMPARFAAASALVLATQGMASLPFHLFDIPHVFWEEQFGMVLAEAMAAGLAIISTTSGAVPEVLAGSGVPLVAPGDWPAIAKALAQGPLSRPPGQRVSYPPEIIDRYSTSSAATRLAAAYRGLVTAQPV